MKYFKNWSSEDFTGKWDGVEQVIKAGKIEAMPDYLAKHYAKHLTNRELFKANLPLVCAKRDEFYAKCFANVEVKETITETKPKPRKGSETMSNSIPFEDLKAKKTKTTKKSNKKKNAPAKKTRAYYKAKK